MNITHLRYAIEVEKTGSISQAADNLYMGQPNLSKAIKELEESVGIIIFKRTSRGVIVTPSGFKFLRYAQNILNQLDEMESIYTIHKTNTQSLNVAFPRASYISQALTNFVNSLSLEKEIDINILETNNTKIIKNVVEGENSFGIIRFQSSQENFIKNYLFEKNLDFEEIYEFEYLALMSKNHPLANEKEVIYNKLHNYIEIVHGDITSPSVSYLDVKKQNPDLHPSKLKISVYERGSQFDLLSQVPTTYMWVSPIPQDILNRQGLIQRKCIVPNHKFKDFIIFPKSYKFNEYEKDFITEVKKVCTEISKITYN